MDSFELYVTQFLIRRLFSRRKLKALEELAEKATKAATALSLISNI